MELKGYQRWALILLSAAMLLQGKSVSTTLMTCHNSGKQQLTVGIFDACCTKDQSKPVSSVQDKCCDFSQNVQLFSNVLSQADAVKLFAPVFLRTFQAEWTFRVPELRHEYHVLSNAPPLWRYDRLTHFCKLNL